MALAYWRERGFSLRTVQEGTQNFDQHLVARLLFQPGEEVKLLVSKRVHETMEGHLPAVVAFFADIMKKWSGDLPHGPVIVWLEDGMWTLPYSARVPIFAFGKYETDMHTFLIPDPAFMHSKGYAEEIKNIQSFDRAHPWEVKKPTVFWRGASTGLGLYHERWREGPRVKICLMARELGKPDVLDAAITKLVTYRDNPSAEELPKLGVVAPAVPFEEFLQHRYLVDLDGEFCAWKSLFLKLASGSVVLKVESHLRQWYYHRLKAWEHYIPLKKDLSDLMEKIEWMRANDSECQEISRRARALIAELSYEGETERITETLQTLFSYLRTE